VKNANANGSLIAASNNTGVRFAVESDGSIRVGNFQPDGTGVTLRINAANGTIENRVGSGLPLAYGTVASNGEINADSGTRNNWSVRSVDAGRYEITIPGATSVGSTTVVTPLSDAARFATVQTRFQGSPDRLLIDVRVFNASGALQATPFAFVTFKPGM
jgi:hypothetical protein